MGGGSKVDNQSLNRAKVTIHGIEYTLRGTVSQEHLLKVAGMVDRMMSEIANSASYMDERKVAVLTAINLADELERLRADYQDLLNLLEDKTKGDESK